MSVEAFLDIAAQVFLASLIPACVEKETNEKKVIINKRTEPSMSIYVQPLI